MEIYEEHNNGKNGTMPIPIISHKRHDHIFEGFINEGI
jgi:hypothetical protein